MKLNLHGDRVEIKPNAWIVGKRYLYELESIYGIQTFLAQCQDQNLSLALTKHDWILAVVRWGRCQSLVIIHESNSSQLAALELRNY
jgi:hypothetical protein